MTLERPRQHHKARFPWTKGADGHEHDRREGPIRTGAPKVKDSWHRLKHSELEPVRQALGLSELEMARVLGVEKRALQALQRGPGAIIGPAVKLIALLRSVPPEMRVKMVAFLMSPEMPTLPPT